MSKQPTVIGLGAASALAAGALSSVLGARAAKLATRTYDPGGDRDRRIGTARARRIGDDVIGAERLLRLAGPALREAVSDAGHDPDVAAKVFIALPELGTYPAEDEQRLGAGFLDALSREAQVGIDLVRSRAVRLGHAGFAAALELALTADGDGPVFVGGAHTSHHPVLLDRMIEQKRVLSEAAHAGMVPSEGAAFLAIGSAKTRPALASVTKTASGKELPKTWEEPRVAELLTDLVYLVGESLPSRPIGWVFTDLNGERHRSKEWDFCSIRCSELIMPPKSTIVRLAETWGDTGAASGALAAVYAAWGWRAGFAPAASALITLSSEGDERGVIGLEAPP